MAEIGQNLREARMRARIDISEVEARTKIRARYLRAIENEEWDLLPGPVYIKSFLRTYADYLGLDSRLLVDEFKRQYELPSDESRQPALRQGRERRERRERDLPRRPRRPLIPPWAVVGVVLVAVVVALYLIGSGSNHKHPTPTSSTAGTHKPRHHASPGPTRKVKPKPKMARLKLVATGPVYICVENRAGKVMMPATTYNPGQAIPTLKSRQLFLTLGNNAITVTANGKPYVVQASATAIGLKVTSQGVSKLAPGRGPTCASGGSAASTSGATGTPGTGAAGTGAAGTGAAGTTGATG